MAHNRNDIVTLIRRNDVDMTSFGHYVPAGLDLILPSRTSSEVNQVEWNWI